MFYVALPTAEILPYKTDKAGVFATVLNGMVSIGEANNFIKISIFMVFFDHTPSCYIMYQDTCYKTAHI